MDIRATLADMDRLIHASHELKKEVRTAALEKPQLIEEEDMHQLIEKGNKLSSNFETVNAFLYTFERITPSSKKWVPKLKAEK